VPDPPGAFTSEEGWKLDGSDPTDIRPAVAELKRLGCRVILFLDPDPVAVERVPGSGADGIEIYTGTYAAAFRAGNGSRELQACAATAARARERGLVVNAGHDLNLDNLPALVAAMPFLAEASIGHELTADALVIGFAAAVQAYKTALSPKA
jgi:pyridoxine 5-phosphate synthase